MNRASQFRLTSALDYVITIDTVFDHLCCAILQLQELCHIALAIGNGTVAPAWSIDQGLLFFDGRFYILATRPAGGAPTWQTITHEVPHSLLPPSDSA